MQVIKFGGSSLEGAERLESVTQLIGSRIEPAPLIVVVSAIGATTDQLLEAAHAAAAGDQNYRRHLHQILEFHRQIENRICPSSLDEMKKTLEEWEGKLRDVLHGVYLVRELSARTLDYLLSFGERFSAFILTHALNEKRLDASFVDARKLITTNERFGNAIVDRARTEKDIQFFFRDFSHKVAVVTGFIAKSASSVTTTLGRGGSDYTASLLGAALSVSVVEIWTDVEGILSGDPRKIHKPFPVPEVTFEEAMELSHFGAKVIYPPTMQPLRERNIPIHIRSTLNPKAKGTFIRKEVASQGRAYTGISSIDEVYIFRLQGSGMVGVAGISARLFGALAKKGVNVIFVSQASSEHTICFAVSPQQGTLAKSAIEEEFNLEMSAGLIDPLRIESQCSLLSVVGENMRNTPGVSGRIFSALGQSSVNIIAVAQGSSERNISLAIKKEDETRALNSIHERLFHDAQPLRVMIAGLGQIGRELLSQLHAQERYLREILQLRLQIIGLATSKKFLWNNHGIDLETWASDFDSSGQETKSGLRSLLTQAVHLKLAGSILVDCTAADHSEEYVDALRNAISVVTANKRVQTGSARIFQEIEKISSRQEAGFYSEASVGAGLPILSTLKDLKNTGDEIQSIEGVFSGTLSFLFNKLSEGEKFSEIVRAAHQKGYTEPDPREDLNGLDIARKLLILARSWGLYLELNDIQVEPLLPPDLFNIDSVEEFLVALSALDENFHERVETARSRGARLAYRGFLSKDGASVSLSEIEASHPLHSLSGSDNMFIFHTKRYSETPLVIRGPGAGAGVTAAAVFSDILRGRNTEGRII